MSMDLSQIFGVATAIIGLAIISVAIINGDKTAAIIGQTGTAFTSAINAATHPGTTASQSK
jgi:hypothetical protein